MKLISLLTLAVLALAEEPKPIGAEERDRIRVLQIAAYDKLERVSAAKLKRAEAETEILKAEAEFAAANAKIMEHVRELYKRIGVNGDAWQLKPDLAWERTRTEEKKEGKK